MAKHMQFCGQKYIGGDDAPIGFGKIAKHTYETDEISGQRYRLCKLFRDLDGPLDHGTGWYLYGAAHQGTFCHRTLLSAVDVANAILLDRSLRETRVSDMDVQPMKDEFSRVMESIGRAANSDVVTALAKRAGDLWREMGYRGVEFK